MEILIKIYNNEISIIELAKTGNSRPLLKSNIDKNTVAEIILRNIPSDNILIFNGGFYTLPKKWWRIWGNK